MLIGKALGPFVIEKELGSGAMGTVFLARHKKTGKRVAIKLMSLALGTSDNAIKRFKREVDILKQLDHVNIVKYIVSGRYHGAPFYIMEYVEGESLDHILSRRTRLPWEEVVRLGMDLCAALQHAHDKGIIHRDLKPSNLMVLKDGVVKLTDFGIAKDVDVTALTAANSTVGTAAYMSPEQCRGARDISGKTDLYSMGIMFYELLTGRKPFTGETAMEVFLQHANKTDYKTPSEIVLEVPLWLNTLVGQLMEKEPGKRPASGKAVANSLQLIKEKIELQRSAGVDAATKRRVDRAPGDKKLDEEDKAAARVMLGKKKKVKAVPFYAKGWFTLLSLGVLATLFGAFIYFVFFKAPDAEGLYTEAQTLMKSGQLEDYAKAHAADGPVTEFLLYYPQHEKAAQVRAWADQADFKIREEQMHRGRTRSSVVRGVDAKEEQMARDALDDEDAGKLKEAAKRWEELSKRKGNVDADIHKWGLVGERYLKDIQAAEAEDLKLKTKLDAKGKPAEELEKLALDACRAELDKAHALAKSKWEELKRSAKVESPRRWYLIAARRLRELGEAKDEAK